MTARSQFDVVIVGAGIAGMAAAAVVRRYGLSMCVIEEQARAASGSNEDLTRIAPATACAVFPKRSECGFHEILLLHGTEKLTLVEARQILISTGGYDMPVAFPGWDLPGVSDTRALESLLAAERAAGGRSVVLAGSDPLLFTLAAQLLTAGARVTAVVTTQSDLMTRGLLRRPRTTLPGCGQLLGAGVRIYSNALVTEGLGTRHLQAVRVRTNTVPPRTEVVECDTLGVCFGFLPSSELTRQAGVRHRRSNDGSWIVQVDDFMQTTVEGLSAAGELTGASGAEAAALSGEIAGVGIALRAGCISADTARTQARGARGRLSRINRLKELVAKLTRPLEGLLGTLPQPDTVICHCEDVRQRDILSALRSDPAVSSASAAKLLTRAGMGACQGRMCEINVRRLVAQHRGCQLEDVAGFTVRPPVRPIPVALLAASARTEASACGDAVPGDPDFRSSPGT